MASRGEISFKHFWWRVTYLSHISHMRYVEKICHVEKFYIYMHDRCGGIWNFSACAVRLRMWRKSKKYQVCWLLTCWGSSGFTHHLSFTFNWPAAYKWTLVLRRISCSSLRVWFINLLINVPGWRGLHRSRGQDILSPRDAEKNAILFCTQGDPIHPMVRV